MCKKILFTLCLVLCIALIGCQTEGALQPSDGGNTKNKISDEMQDTIDNLIKLGIYDCYVGYKSDGSIAAWVNIPSEIEFIETNYYDPYIAKTIFDGIDNIETLYLWGNSFSGNLDYCQRTMYSASELKNLPSDYDKFKENMIRNKIKWSSTCDTNDFYKDECDDAPTSFIKLMQKLYGDRLVKAETVDSGVITMTSYVTVDGFPENISINDEIAKAFVIGLGRFDRSLGYNVMEEMNITYMSNDTVAFEVSMLIGDDEHYYSQWRSTGLNPAEWQKYSTGKTDIYENINLQIKTDEAWLEKGAIYQDPGYANARNLLESFSGVKEFFLGYNGKNYVAHIILDHTEDEEDFQKEMDMTLLAMKYPFEKLVFFVDDDGELMSQACIDRERYNTLMYMNEDMENAVFDFLPPEWPLMAKGFEAIVD